MTISIRNIALAAAALLSAAMLVSCQEDPQPEQISVSIKAASAPSTSSSQFLTVKASGDWTLTVETGEEEGEAGWARFMSWGSEEYVSTLTGSGDDNTIILYWAKNLAPAERTCTITLRSGAQSASCEFRQEAAPTAPNNLPTDIKSDNVAFWMELPAVDKDAIFISHDMKVGSTTTRNYAYCWDSKNLVATWVAYPLNAWTIGGSVNRTDAWSLDPKLPRSAQPVLYGGFRSSGRSIDRGHQCPSADRLASLAANEATFYGTNMTPQASELNQHSWATLEGMVRDWSRSFDTLYVVTGCDVKGATEVAYDNEGKAVTIPAGYFKALLGYKKSGTVANTSKTGGYSGCAFYFEHRQYSNTRAAILGQQMSIDELETKLGIDFYVNLPAAVGEANATAIESNVDSYWKK